MTRTNTNRRAGHGPKPKRFWKPRYMLRVVLEQDDQDRLEALVEQRRARATDTEDVNRSSVVRELLAQAHSKADGGA